MQVIASSLKPVIFSLVIPLDARHQKVQHQNESSKAETAAAVETVSAAVDAADDCQHLERSQGVKKAVVVGA
jgi:hypothetical protein